MEKTISIRNTKITFSIWDLGGQREFVNMLPLVCNDAVAILFMFDLSRKSTLTSIKEWYRQARGFNKVNERTAAGSCAACLHAFPPSYPCSHRVLSRSSLAPSTTNSQCSRRRSRTRQQRRYDAANAHP